MLKATHTYIQVHKFSASSRDLNARTINVYQAELLHTSKMISVIVHSGNSLKEKFFCLN